MSLDPLDGTVAAPKNYKVAFENDRIRVIKISYDAGEKGPMHSHRAGVFIALVPLNGTFTYPDGRFDDVYSTEPLAMLTPPVVHMAEAKARHRFEGWFVELKGTPYPTGDPPSST